jgi:hypothetical protein
MMMTRARGISLAVSAAAAEAAAAFLLATTALTATTTSPSTWSSLLSWSTLSSTWLGLALAALLHGLAVVGVVPLLNAAARGFALSRPTPLAVVTALFVPVLGPLGLWALFRALGRSAHAAGLGAPPTITRLPSLPADAPEPVGEPLGMGALAARIRYSRDANTRLKSVLATRRLDGACATQLLRAALRDSHEDVRLLAYALLEDRERQADATVRDLLATLAAAPPARRAAINERLANAYWELCYQGLVAGELESFSLARALEHLDAAGASAAVISTANPASAFGGKSMKAPGVTTPPAILAARLLLRGRVLLRQGAPAAARAALAESRRLGMPARTVDPYLLETAVAERGRGARA